MATAGEARRHLTCIDLQVDRLRGTQCDRHRFMRPLSSSSSWRLVGASHAAKKVTEENIPPSTFGNRIAETITVHTTATHHPQSNKTSCARRNLCTSLNQHSSAIPSVGLLIAQPQAITRSPLLHCHVPSPQARVVRQTRRPPARTCTYQAARKRTAERSTLAPSPITRRPHSEAGS